MFSKKVWDTLSPDDQALIRKFAKEAQLEERKLWAAAEERALADMKAHGVTITEISPAEKKRFQEAMKPVWDKYGAKYAGLIKRNRGGQVRPRSPPRRRRRRAGAGAFFFDRGGTAMKAAYFV